jgi:L,D-transpeptidase ErfK/SrfK
MDVRVGKNEKKFLKMAGREVSLQTPIGKGEIVRINKAPWFINPVDNKRYYKTRRDDGQYTSLPLIPWLEPSINGQRPGSMIHPTTNKSTLGKAASNGCVGLAEGDMWVVYYHAPLGTMVEFKYELNVKSERGDTLKLEDIYKLNE